MAQTNKIDALVYPKDAVAPDKPFVFRDVNFISFVSSPGGSGEGTYGIPAKLSDRDVKDEGLPVRVLYVNPANITALDATRHA